MSDTSIEWTDKTWNPVRGCSRVSPGCGGATGVGGCYAERVAARFSGPGMAYEGLARMGPNGARWTGEVRMVPAHLADPLRWKKPQRIFVNSMSDLFHQKLANEDIATVFGVMAAAPRHTFQVLTKRPERMVEWFRWAGADSPAAVVTLAAQRALGGDSRSLLARAWRACAYNVETLRWPLPNVILGVTAEDQQRADERLPLLVATPAAKRFVSVEPQLEQVDLSRWMHTSATAGRCVSIDGDWWHKPGACPDCRNSQIDQVICGSESGPGARPWDESWARLLRDQCAASGTAFFLKQKLNARGRKVSLPMLDGRQHVDQPR